MQEVVRPTIQEVVIPMQEVAHYTGSSYALGPRPALTIQRVVMPIQEVAHYTGNRVYAKT